MMLNTYKKFYEQARNHPKAAIMVILASLVLIIFLIRPSYRSATPVSIEDKCGKFLNLVSHTIDSETICRSRCRSQCVAREKYFLKFEFLKSGAGCNKCLCYCK